MVWYGVVLLIDFFWKYKKGRILVIYMKFYMDIMFIGVNCFFVNVKCICNFFIVGVFCLYCEYFFFLWRE